MNNQEEILGSDNNDQSSIKVKEVVFVSILYLIVIAIFILLVISIINQKNVVKNNISNGEINEQIEK